MELARALTGRKRQGAADMPHYQPNRATSMRKAGSIKRSAISSPLELLFTTNALAFEAPNIYGSSDESDSSLTFSASSRATTPETPASEAPSPVEPNHLSTYFQSASNTRSSKDSIEVSSPAIPQRALSHTKKSHQDSARIRRSASKTTLPPTAIHNLTTTTRSSADMFTNQPEPDHPFGAELTKVNELAEEIGARNVLVVDEEERYLMEHGLCKFGAEDYMGEIQGLFGGAHNNPFSLSWI
ncbi:hypothetical protein ACLMJK_006708 [Lecanora helva]